MKAFIAVVLLSVLAAALCATWENAYRESWTMETSLQRVVATNGDGRLSSSNVATISAELPFYPKLRAMLLAAQCPDGVLVNNACLAVVKKDVNYAGAVDACKKWGGNVASIASAEENAAVQKQVAAQHCNAAWLGGSDHAKEGSWQWLDGTTWKYTNWAPGEPNNYVVSSTVGDEDNLEMYEDGRWNDIAGSTLGRAHCYVCKRRVNVPQFDRCAVNHGGCDANAVCTPAGDSVTCKCKPGFSGNGRTCTDINECATNNGGCDVHATCTNTIGSYQCKCKAGFSGNGKTCTDINECLVNNGGCDDNAVCTNTIGSNTCACKSGFQGNGQKDHCAPICQGIVSGKNCYRLFKGDLTYPEALQACKVWGGLPASIHDSAENSLIQQQVQSNRCGAAWLGGSDSVKEGDWKWVDGSAWNYKNWAPGEPNNYVVSSSVGDEDNLEMYEDGRWNDIAASTKGRSHCYVCKRTYGDKENPVPNKCLVNNGGCSGDASCSQSQLDGTVTCKCNPGFAGDGKTCTDVNECLTNNGGCDANAVCTNTIGSRTCACKPGFSGNGVTCQDVNECLTNNGGCDVNAVCTNTVGSRTCSCKPGFSGNGLTCADVNECLTNNGGCDANAICTNTIGSRTCACKAGFSGNGLTCADVNECLTNNGGCDANAVCTNTIGSRTCACKAGFSGNGFTCADVNECLTNNGGCDANAVCTNTVGSRTCQCRSGYSGDGTTCKLICDGVTSSRGKCYKVVNQQVPYSQAVSACQSWGGQLASITNQEENEIIRSRINGCNTWIGATDEGTEGRFRWVDGSAWGYTHWAPGEPNNYGIGENLVEMYGDGNWNDINTTYRSAACYACSK